MLATHGPTADELLVYPLPGLREGEERYVLAFGIPTATPGLRFICREPFDTGGQSQWDHPLGARFEEPDAVCVFDDVLIPWDRVFLYNDVKMGNALFAQASIRNHTGHQTAIRGLAKCQLLTGIAIAMTRTVKSDVFLHVQEQLGELLGYLQLIEARDPDGGAEGGADRPRRATSGLCAAAGAALPPAEDVRAHGAGDAGAGCRRSADQSRRKPTFNPRSGPTSRATIAAPASMPTSASSSSSSPGTPPARNSASACCNTSATTPATRCGSAPPIISTTTSRRCWRRSSGR